MKLSTKYIFFCIFMLGSMVFMLMEFSVKNNYLFGIAEILLALSAVSCIYLYKGIIQPSNIIAAGVESMKDKDFSIRLAKTGHEDMDMLIAVYNQMMDQLQEERITQAEKNHVLDKLIQASPSGIVILDSGQMISSMNAAAARMLDIGAIAVKGLSLRDVPGRLAKELMELANGESLLVQLSGAELYKCQKAHFSDRGYTHFFIMIEALRDEVYRLEKQAYEKVIRMMSHETNNSIGAINSILSTVKGFKEQISAEHRTDYEDVLSVAMNRNKSLSTIMSNFAAVVKVPGPVKENADLHQLLRSVQLLMSAEGNKKAIQWLWELDETEFMVDMDVAQMEQVLINVIKNAIEASASGGMIILRTNISNRQLSILDNGIGISADGDKYMFTPFFSTKKNGQGIGLTLSREILFNHHYQFTLSSNEGWTEFNLQF